MFIILPYADDNPRKSIPVVTLLLIAANVLIFFAFGFSGGYEDTVLKYGFTPERFAWMTIFSSMFLHGSISHLIFNMWFLWLFGDNLEDSLGHGRFLGFYFLGGVFAAVLHLLVSNPATRAIPCIGASGAISAVMGGYISYFPRARIRMFVLLLFWARTFKLSALIFLGLWFAEQFLLGGLTASSELATEVAYGAHIGGFIYGAIFCFFCRASLATPDPFAEGKGAQSSGKKTLAAEPAVVLRPPAPAKTSAEYIQEIERFIGEEKTDEALTGYAELERFPGACLNPQAQLAMARSLYMYGRKFLALRAYLRFLIHHPDAPEAGLVQCRIGQILIRDFNEYTGGVKFLKQGLERYQPGQEDDPCLHESRRQLSRAEAFFNQDFLNVSHDENKQQLFTVLRQRQDEGALDIDAVSKALESIGAVRGVNAGFKLAHNARHHLASQDGIILNGISLIEAILAARKLQSLGIDVVALGQDDLPHYPKIIAVTEASVVSGALELITEDKQKIEVLFSDIISVTLGQVPYFVFRKEEDTSAFALGGGDEEGGVRIDDLNVNRLIDFYTPSCRLRVSSLRFTYRDRSANRIPEPVSGGQFLEDLAQACGGKPFDEASLYFLVTKDWSRLNFRDIQALSQRSFWSARIKLVNRLLGIPGL